MRIGLGLIALESTLLPSSGPLVDLASELEVIPPKTNSAPIQATAHKDLHISLLFIWL